MKHGTDCHKMEHRTHPDGQGYLHAADDDAPYDVDGQMYCGRCHYAIDAPDAIVDTMTSFSTPERPSYERLEREHIAMRAQRDRAIGVLAIMVFHFGNPKRDEWLNDEGFEAAKAAVDAARKLLKGQ